MRDRAFPVFPHARGYGSSLLRLEADPLVAAVAEGLVPGVAAAAQIDVAALSRDRITLRVQHLTLAFHLKWAVRYRFHDHGHRRLPPRSRDVGVVTRERV